MYNLINRLKCCNSNVYDLLYCSVIIKEQDCVCTIDNNTW